MHAIHEFGAHMNAVKAVEQKIHQLADKKRLLKSASGVHTEDDFTSVSQKRAYNLLHHTAFDMVFGLAILFNLVLVIIETDSVAKGTTSPVWAETAGWVILVMFVFELSLRLYVLKCDFFFDGMNCFDFVLVLVDGVMNVLAIFAGKLFPVSFLRIVRLFKLARVSKAFRVFPELRLMMGGLLGSMKAIFWGTVLLSFALIVVAILAVQFIHPLNRKLAETGEFDGNCERCPRAYASVFDASLTFCQQIVAGDAWGQGNIQLIEHYPASSIFFAFSYMSIGMAILNLILGVVVDVASQSRDRLRVEMADEKLMEMMQLQGQFLDICKLMDTDANGELTREELLTGFAENEQFRSMLGDMDISEDDLEVLWTSFDADKSGAISYTEFVSSCYKLKSSNTHFMLAYIKYYITQIRNKICSDVEDLKNELKNEEKKLDEGILDISTELKNEEKKVAEYESETRNSIRHFEECESEIAAAFSSPERLPHANEQGRVERSEASDTFAMDEFRDLIANLTGEIKELLNGVRSTKQFTPEESPKDKVVSQIQIKSQDNAQVGDSTRFLRSSAAAPAVGAGSESLQPFKRGSATSNIRVMRPSRLAAAHPSAEDIQGSASSVEDGRADQMHSVSSFKL